LGLLRYLYAFVLCAAPLLAESVTIHSEFQRIDPFGHTVPIDQSDYPREILSPEIPRNAHTIFNVAVNVPPNTSYFLYVGVNPPNLIQATLYKEDFVSAGGDWIPDLLTPVHLPAFGVLHDAAASIPGQSTRCYLLDLWVPPSVDVQRVRVEVLLKVGTWYVSPMEVRIGAARVPLTGLATRAPFTMRDESMPPVRARIDASAMELLAGYLLGQPPVPVDAWPGGPRNLREAVRRSAEQDIAIARQQTRIPQNLWFLAGDGILQRWMQGPFTFRWSGAEWYLRARDWIYRNAAK
jgi:hypothetical protein